MDLLKSRISYRRPTRLFATALWSCVWLSQGRVAAQPEEAATPILVNLSFAQLSEIQITTASKRPELRRETPAAVFVLTEEDIVRSGATAIPEVLRYVPGLNVAQISGSSWGVGARGFNTQFASKLLVMMDGRSIYTPYFAGVNWEIQDYLLDDLERIEVVLGPGGSIWGANAMNGVINIITKSAKDTQGTLLYGGGGNEKLALAGGRVGGQLGEHTWGRVYLKYGLTDDTRMSSGLAGNDGVSIGQGGFRLDGEVADRSRWTLQGDGYWGEQEYRVNVPSLSAPPTYLLDSDGSAHVSGANLLSRWETDFSAESTLRLQAYYDYIRREGVVVNNHVQTADFELHHTWSGLKRHRIDSGLGYRWLEYGSSPAFVRFTPAEATAQLFNGFVQDEWQLLPERVTLTTGIKVEHNDFTGWELQPNARLTWQAAKRHTLWAAWSQAVRTPSLVEMDGQIDPRILPPPNPISASLPAVFRGLGNPDLSAERLQAWEIGWRWQAAEKFALELNTFYYQYDDLIMIARAGVQPQASPPAAIVRAPYTNGMAGWSCGGEISALWEPMDGWRLRASYSYLRLDLNARVPDPFGFLASESNAPPHSVVLRSSVRLNRAWDFDTALRFVDRATANGIPSYAELDVRLAWHPRSNLELALIGQNLLHDQHPESRPSPLGSPTEIQRSVFARVTLRF